MSASSDDVQSRYVCAEEVDEEEIELRRQAMRARVIAQKEDTDLLDIEEEAEEKASEKDGRMMKKKKSHQNMKSTVNQMTKWGPD